MNQRWLIKLETIKPVKKYKIGEVTFLIYKAKNLYNPNWNSGLLKKITQEARKSYLRYGSMRLVDEYDKNAEVYLCRAIDMSSEEWLCLRFVPGKIGGNSLQDLGQYICKNEPLSKMVAGKLFPGVKNFQNKLVAVSRVCGISPYTFNLTKSKISYLPIRMKYTAKSFALINKVFFSSSKFTYLLGVFRKELLERLLCFDSQLSLDLLDAYKVLGCSSDEIRLNRSLLAYRFPGYFLNISQLIDLLGILIKRKDLTVSSVKTFFRLYNPNFKKYLKDKKYVEVLSMTEGLSKLLLVRGKIIKSKITGNQLRDLVMKNVDDGPILKIMPVNNWIKQLQKIKL